MSKLLDAAIEDATRVIDWNGYKFKVSPVVDTVKEARQAFKLAVDLYDGDDTAEETDKAFAQLDEKTVETIKGFAEKAGIDLEANKAAVILAFQNYPVCMVAVRVTCIDATGEKMPQNEVVKALIVNKRLFDLVSDTEKSPNA